MACQDQDTSHPWAALPGTEPTQPGSQPATHLHQIRAGVEDPGRSRRDGERVKRVCTVALEATGSRGARELRPRGHAAGGPTGQGVLCQFPALLTGGLSSQRGRTHLPRSGKTEEPAPGRPGGTVGLTSRSLPASPQSWHGGPGSSCPTPDDKSFEWAGRRAACDEGGHWCWSAPTTSSATAPQPPPRL